MMWVWSISTYVGVVLVNHVGVVLVNHVGVVYINPCRRGLYQSHVCVVYINPSGCGLYVKPHVYCHLQFCSYDIIIDTNLKPWLIEVSIASEIVQPQ